MSQAALNTRNSDEETPSSRRNNGTRLAGILFLNGTRLAGILNFIPADGTVHRVC
ncbi:hypothetical protein LTSEALA_0190 [Salmonella enterica subsp. enterica serovar Alachua str. R6-377]|uniref:Uncharacterized protein n=1 Tax=Salmonella enterica subsp. enterica serovar Alachua str. R6-377 TaxID=913241 RepID=G5LIV5_SALET|nr:hypothetical protein LTSEALA_0190 [Salmonella enterica subsp. enterica serovar Alachua str. R6-377]EHC70480.1 hypothetical protein LTSEJOH_0263 [Salmonella enterica subsp. enterica serovar Johannesburg str. S5-703]